MDLIGRSLTSRIIGFMAEFFGQPWIRQPPLVGGNGQPLGCLPWPRTTAMSQADSWHHPALWWCTSGKTRQDMAAWYRPSAGSRSGSGRVRN